MTGPRTFEPLSFGSDAQWGQSSYITCILLSMSPDWLYYILLILILLAGLFINILGLPGLWLMIAAAGIYAWVTAGAFMSWGTLIALLVLALLAELAEFVAGAAGSKAAGGSKRGMAGAIVGGLVGGILGTPIPIPIVGTIVGACLGAFVGAFIVERSIGRDTNESLQIGFGAAKGRFWGILIKSAFGVVMLIVAAWMALPIGRKAAPLAPPAATMPASTRPTTSPTTAPEILDGLTVERASTRPAP